VLVQALLTLFLLEYRNFTIAVEAATCPVSTMECTPCKAGEQYCRHENGETTGYKGWACQNNNPGNIRYSDPRINLIENNGGFTPCGQRGGFMIFRTYSEGKESLKAYIKAINRGQHSLYTNCGDCTLLFFFSKYAPNQDNNDSNNYASRVAQRIGVTTSTKLNWVVANKLNEFVEAIQWHEGWFAKNPEVREKVQKLLIKPHIPGIFMAYLRPDISTDKLNALKNSINAKVFKVSTLKGTDRKFAYIVLNNSHELEEAMVTLGSDLDVYDVGVSGICTVYDDKSKSGLGLLDRLREKLKAKKRLLIKR